MASNNDGSNNSAEDDGSRTPWRYGALGPPDSPPLEPTAFQRAQDEQAELAREMQENATELAEAEMRQEEDEDDLLKRYGRRADKFMEALRAHRTQLPALKRAVETESARFEAACKSNATGTALWKAFETHVQNAGIVSKAPVRQYTIMGWFTSELPVPLGNAIQKVVGYHHEDTRLRWGLHKYEVASKDSTHASCPEYEMCNSEHDMHAHLFLMPVFGWGREEQEDGFTHYQHVVCSEADLRRLRANFDVRKLWLAHAPAQMRFGFEGKDDENWKLRLDGRMVSFITDARACIDEKEMSDAIYKQHVPLPNTVAPPSEADAGAEAKRLRIVGGNQLMRDIVQFGDYLDNRKDRIRSAYHDLCQAQINWEASRRFSDDQQAQHFLDCVDDYRMEMARGTSINEDRVELEGKHSALIPMAEQQLAASRAAQAAQPQPMYTFGNFQITPQQFQQISQNSNATNAPTAQASRSSSQSSGNEEDGAEEGEDPPTAAQSQDLAESEERNAEREDGGMTEQDDGDAEADGGGSASD